jgi:hypothetical protein
MNTDELRCLGLEGKKELYIISIVLTIVMNSLIRKKVKKQQELNQTEPKQVFIKMKKINYFQMNKTIILGGVGMYILKDEILGIIHSSQPIWPL